ncbi:MAG: hypothetical protein IIB62_04590 [Proteobacteria bacterium]|nr:hypothetical protein [Pseudomonadota bacterium]
MQVNLVLALLGDARIDWRRFLSDAVLHPWTAGLMVTGMLVTTLAPTALHLGYALGGTLFQFSPRARAAADLIPAPRGRWKTVADRHQVTRTLIYRKFWRLIAMILANAAILGLLWLLITWTASVGWTLRNVAYCATAWGYEHCPLF